MFLFRRRLSLVAFLVFVAFCGLFGRFFYLQVVQHAHFETLAETNRIAIVPIVPNRGVITDRNGVVLAQSYSAYTLEITPSRVKDLDETIDRLAGIVDIQPRDRKRFRKLLEESKNFESLPIRTRLTDDEVARFAVNRYRFPGVDIKARLFRNYPFGEVASHVVGYISRINDKDNERIAGWEETANYKGSDYIGKVGIELSYERELHGTTGVEDVEVDSGGRAVRTLKRQPPIAGNNLTLSLDIALQQVAEAAFGDRRGALVAIDPASGDVLAFVSQAGLRSEPVRRRHRCRELAGVERIARQAAAQPAAARRVSAGLDDQAVPRAVGADVGPAHARARRSTTPASSRFLVRHTGSATTSPADTARSTCTSRSSCRATRITTCSRTIPTSTTRRASLARSASARRPASTSKASSTGVLPSREWKRQRFAGKNFREEHRKWYLGDSISAGIGQGYNAFTPIQLAHAIAMIAGDGVGYYAAPGRRRCRT